jgi:hypothetical protein
MDRSASLLLPEVNYFQVVFTLPDRLSGLVLGNRRELYRLLFRSAWRSLQQVLKKQNIDPAALLVLHTWNQELGHHPHIHALVPGGGPSLNQDNDQRWVTARDTTRPYRDKPSLVDNVTLGRAFRDTFVRGLGWLIRHDRLKLHDEWELLHQPKVLRRWLNSLRSSDWNVFIEGPPHGQSDPQQVLKYLTRYMTGGPISDRRIESDEHGNVTFQARSKSKAKTKNGKPRRIELPGAEFVRHWSLHILPKGFTRSRAYGGFYGRRRKAYLQTCRQLLGQTVEDSESEPTPVIAKPLLTGPTCPRCEIEMVCIGRLPRPSWKDILSSGSGQQPTRFEKKAGHCSPADSSGSVILPRPDD